MVGICSLPSMAQLLLSVQFSELEAWRSGGFFTELLGLYRLLHVIYVLTSKKASTMMLHHYH
jgi:hypothetical protein